MVPEGPKPGDTERRGDGRARSRCVPRSPWERAGCDRSRLGELRRQLAAGRDPELRIDVLEVVL
ncbi:MAG: hypothetical protein ACREQ5_21375, partial [Candidatus Dormibacteria bacterium]